MKFHLRSSSHQHHAVDASRRQTAAAVAPPPQHEEEQHPLRAMKTSVPPPPTNPATDDESSSSSSSADIHQNRSSMPKKAPLHLIQRDDDCCRSPSSFSSRHHHCDRALQFFRRGRHGARSKNTRAIAAVTAALPTQPPSTATEFDAEEILLQVAPSSVLPTSPRVIRFGRVEVQEYGRILGDHPFCSSGLPLTLGWEVESKRSFDLEEFENGRLNRSKREWKLGSADRREILQTLTETSENYGNKDANAAAPALYSEPDLRRAERRLVRERAENRRMHKRTNQRFFRPVSLAEQSKFIVPDCDVHAQ